jgi:DNA-binding CsgD family transcriptional regulator
MLDPFLRSFGRRWLEPLAMLRCDAVGDDAWYESPFYQNELQSRELDDCILSAVPLPGLRPFMAVVCLIASAPAGRRMTGNHFTPAACRLVELAHAELRWIYYPEELAPDGPIEPLALPPELSEPPEARAAQPPVPHMSPRHLRVLSRLLYGDSQKEAAHHLGISVHAVHLYVRELYHKLGVSSRGELMARWVHEIPPVPPHLTSQSWRPAASSAALPLPE